MVKSTNIFIHGPVPSFSGEIGILWGQHWSPVDNNHIKIWGLVCQKQGLYSLSGKTSYRKISWSLEAARFGIKLFQSLWNLAGTSAALLPRCLSNFRAIRPLQHPISRLRDFTRFSGKTSYRLLNRGPGIKEWEKQLHPTNTAVCNYLSLPFTLASDTYLWNAITCPYLPLAHKSSYLWVSARNT